MMRLNSQQRLLLACIEAAHRHGIEWIPINLVKDIHDVAAREVNMKAYSLSWIHDELARMENTGVIRTGAGRKKGAGRPKKVVAIDERQHAMEAIDQEGDFAILLK